jgi:LDH2 family malate/lactate/ureidoglycolate dehydrogenase
VDSEHFKLPRRPMKVLRETDVSIAFDGGNNVGMLSLFYAAEATIKKAAAHGIALISVNDTWISQMTSLQCLVWCRARAGPTHAGPERIASNP